jgi:hypothetical protein
MMELDNISFSSHLLVLTIFNTYIILSSSCNKICHQKFYLTLVQNLLEMSLRDTHCQLTVRERPNLQGSQMCSPWSLEWGLIVVLLSVRKLYECGVKRILVLFNVYHYMACKWIMVCCNCMDKFLAWHFSANCKFRFVHKCCIESLHQEINRWRGMLEYFHQDNVETHSADKSMAATLHIVYLRVEYP